MAKIETFGKADVALWSEQWHFPVVKGEQYWLLLRTGEGGLDAEQVQDAAADVVQKMVASAEGETETPWEGIRTGPDDWTFGQARPVEVKVSRERPALPRAERVLARRETFPGDGLPTVKGPSAPWYALVHLWWRGNPAEAPWPIYGPDKFGMNITEPDVNTLVWTLDEALVPAEKSPDPGDKTWSQAQAARITEPVGEVLDKAGEGLITAAKVLGGIAVVVGGVWLFKTIREATK